MAALADEPPRLSASTVLRLNLRIVTKMSVLCKKTYGRRLDVDPALGWMFASTRYDG